MSMCPDYSLFTDDQRRALVARMRNELGQGLQQASFQKLMAEECITAFETALALLGQNETDVSVLQSVHSHMVSAMERTAAMIEGQHHARQ